jgi:hypothetical protein
MEYKLIQVISRSQYNITAQPINAEAYEHFSAMVIEARTLAWEAKLPVHVIDKWGTLCIFQVPKFP